MIQCTICDKNMPNAYTLAQHKAKRHADKESIKIEETVIAEGPKEQLLRFSRPIQVTINGKRFEGAVVAVPYEYVPAVMETVVNSYGPDVILV